MDAALIFMIIFLIGLIFLGISAAFGGFAQTAGDVDATGSDFGGTDAGADVGHGDGGGIGGHDMDTGQGGHGLDSGHGDGVAGGHTIHFPRISPVLLAVFATTFGGTAWAFQIYSPWLGLLIIIFLAVLIGSAVSGALSYGLIRTMRNMQASSAYDLTESVGLPGTVTTPIQPGKTGAVDYTIRGRIATNPARSPEELKLGDRVVITEVMGGTLMVRKHREDSRSSGGERREG